MLTLGLYHFWWHLRTHQEMMRFLGKRNHMAWVWALYILSSLGLAALRFFWLPPAKAAYEEALETPVEFEHHADGVGHAYYPDWHGPDLLSVLHFSGLWVPWLLLSLIAFALFAFYVTVQVRTLYANRPDPWMWGPASASILAMFAMGEIVGLLYERYLILLPIALLTLVAYYNLQLLYNEHWRSQFVHEVRGEGWLVGVMPDGGQLRLVDTVCPSCGAPSQAKGMAGTWAEADCEACGRKGKVRLPDPDPSIPPRPVDEGSGTPV